ncbi:hypothetical protein SAMN04515668_2665 [Hymenobacter arizonensis]|uniref:Uncharacterized protein n=1 Tax=Hymenobacter arizonensis TaxID=1227077 RepID=A0A1I5Z382_HYMAR|nr:hypothetical protein SAMN04515668_2665 [Hymenobacter arizonensis]
MTVIEWLIVETLSFLIAQLTKSVAKLLPEPIYFIAL